MIHEGLRVMYEEFEVPKAATFVTPLPFGEGKIGSIYALRSQEEIEQHAQSLAACTTQITISNTADCVDGRLTIALGNGVNDREFLRQRVVRQLPGGLGLAVTKAAVGADLAILRDVKDFTVAYETMFNILKALGYEDGGHGDCGASMKVEETTDKEVEEAPLMLAVPLFTRVDDGTTGLLRLNRQAKRSRLDSGFYGNWSNTWHETFLQAKVPHNYSILEIDHNDEATKGHRELSGYAITTPGLGFAKNRFIETTGQQAFATTVSTADELTAEIIRKIGGSEEERARLRLEFAVDTPQVLSRLAVKGLPVFAEAA